MIGAVREWLVSVVAVSMLLAVAQVLVPEGVIRKIASLTGGLILLAALLQPVLRADIGQLQLDIGDYAEAIEERREELESAEDAALAARIAEQTGAYISVKGTELGLHITAKVQTKPGPDGTPIPWAVEVSGPTSEALAGYIEEGLGIPRERQVWMDDED